MSAQQSSNSSKIIRNLFRLNLTRAKVLVGCASVLTGLCNIASSDVLVSDARSLPAAVEAARKAKIAPIATRYSSNPLNHGVSTPRQLPSPWRPSPQHAVSGHNMLDDDIHFAHSGWQPSGLNPPTTSSAPSLPHGQPPRFASPVAYAPISAEARSGE